MEKRFEDMTEQERYQEFLRLWHNTTDEARAKVREMFEDAANGMPIDEIKAKYLQGRV